MSISANAKVALALITIFSMILVVTLVPAPQSKDEVAQGTLPAFQSQFQMLSYLQTHGIKNGGGQNNALTGGNAESDKATTGHSQTNTQVEGIDELDAIETDGLNIYFASGGRVDIISADPAEAMRNLSTISLSDLGLVNDGSYVNIEGMFLKEGRLFIIASSYVYDIYTALLLKGYWAYDKTKTMVYVFDVTEPNLPRLISGTGLSGSLLTARMYQDLAYIITQQTIWNYDNLNVPIEWTNGSAKELPVSAIRFDPNASSVSMFTTIMALDTDTLESNASAVINSYGGIVYASAENIYLTTVDWGYDISGDVVSTASNNAATTIFRLHLDGMSVQVAGTAVVKGYPLNQFSLDEKDGRLRIVTCSGWPSSVSMVFVLDEQMNVMGELGGLAPNETVQSARFLGDVLYLVTFLQTDPLFVIDLSDPSGPKVTGELVVPGFSSYLHPLGDGRLIGVGMENWTLKISLYDVTDPDHPLEISNIVTDTSAWSMAQWDHHAFLFDPSSGMIAIPVTSYDGANYTYDEGVFVYQVGEDGLSFRGMLQNGERESSARCVVISDVIYTVTSRSVFAWKIEDLGLIGQLVFNDQPYQYFYGSFGATEGMAK